MRTLGLIPARAGSKGIPGKNRRLFVGVPLVYRALSIGRATCDHAVISTDEPDAHGSLILHRPPELAQDDTPMFPVVKHALDYYLDHPGLGLYPDAIVLLQPTQPLRTIEHVLTALRMLEETGADSVVSVVQIPAHYSPDYALDIGGQQVGPFTTACDCGSGFSRVDRMPSRRQDARPAYSRDGTVYAIKRETIEAGSLYGQHCVPLVIPSHESANLDTEDDWTRAESLVKR